MALCTTAERAGMPGFLTAEQVGSLKDARLPSFDALFVRLMSIHHAGAVAMAEDELKSRGDLRLRIMAHGIRHEQQGEIALMNGLAGWPAVWQATRNMFADNLHHGSGAGGSTP